MNAYFPSTLNSHATRFHLATVGENVVCRIYTSALQTRFLQLEANNIDPDQAAPKGAG